MKHLLKVARLGNPVLRRIAQAVNTEAISDPGFQDFIDSMYITMLDTDGIGLAAPQVHKSVRLVVVHEELGLEDEDGNPLTALINPKLETLEGDTASMWEGCLSIPGLRGKVTRPDRIRLNCLDRQGRALEIEIEDYPAIVLQHECDHLEGVLFIDRLDSTQELAFEKELQLLIGDEDEEED